MEKWMKSPKQVYLGLGGLAVVLFLVSASGQSGTYWENGPNWLGAIGWFGFLLTVLVLVVFSVALLMRRKGKRA